MGLSHKGSLFGRHFSLIGNLSNYIPNLPVGFLCGIKRGVVTFIKILYQIILSKLTFLKLPKRLLTRLRFYPMGDFPKEKDWLNMRLNFQHFNFKPCVNPNNAFRIVALLVHFEILNHWRKNPYCLLRNSIKGSKSFTRRPFASCKDCLK